MCGWWCRFLASAEGVWPPRQFSPATGHLEFSQEVEYVRTQRFVVSIATVENVRVCLMFGSKCLENCELM